MLFIQVRSALTRTAIILGFEAADKKASRMLSDRKDGVRLTKSCAGPESLLLDSQPAPHVLPGAVFERKDCYLSTLLCRKGASATRRYEPRTTPSARALQPGRCELRDPDDINYGAQGGQPVCVE